MKTFSHISKLNANENILVCAQLSVSKLATSKTKLATSKFPSKQVASFPKTGSKFCVFSKKLATCTPKKLATKLSSSKSANLGSKFLNPPPSGLICLGGGRKFTVSLYFSNLNAFAPPPYPTLRVPSSCEKGHFLLESGSKFGSKFFPEKTGFKWQVFQTCYQNLLPKQVESFQNLLPFYTALVRYQVFQENYNSVNGFSDEKKHKINLEVIMKKDILTFFGAFFMSGFGLEFLNFGYNIGEIACTVSGQGCSLNLLAIASGGVIAYGVAVLGHYVNLFANNHDGEVKQSCQKIDKNVALPMFSSGKEVKTKIIQPVQPSVPRVYSYYGDK